MEDVQHEKKQLEKTITQIVMENQKLHKEHEEHVHFLEEARNSLATYRKREEEYPFPLFLFSYILPTSFSSSLTLLYIRIPTVNVTS